MGVVSPFIRIVSTPTPPAPILHIPHKTFYNREDMCYIRGGKGYHVGREG